MVFWLCERPEELGFWSSYGSEFCSGGTAVNGDASEKQRLLECIKNSTLKKEALNKPHSLLQNVCFNPTDVAEPLNPGIVSLPRVHAGGEQSGPIGTNTSFS